MTGWNGHIVRGRGAQYVVIYVSQKSGRVRVFDRGHPESEYRSFQTFMSVDDAVRSCDRSYRSPQKAKTEHPKAKRTKRYDLPAIKVRFRVASIIQLIETDGDARCMGAEEVKADQVLPSLRAILEFAAVKSDEYMPKTEIEILPTIAPEDEPSLDTEKDSDESVPPAPW